MTHDSAGLHNEVSQTRCLNNIYYLLVVEAAVYGVAQSRTRLK